MEDICGAIQTKTERNGSFSFLVSFRQQHFISAMRTRVTAQDAVIHFDHRDHADINRQRHNVALESLKYRPPEREPEPSKYGAVL
jgi:hypothetical protein